ncbi:hypothetical protein ATCC90586_007138 [Pythium insidiosum]|nr:hypothetical protein ATCC90586_007138 [Pythium insidiosum]
MQSPSSGAAAPTAVRQSSPGRSTPFNHLQSTSTDASTSEDAQSTVAIELQVRLVRFVLLTTLAAGAIVAAMVVFWTGVHLKTYRAVDLTNAQRTALLDQYNSYVGNVASVCFKPLEMLISVVVPVVFLHAASGAVLRTEMTRSTQLAMLAASSVLGYLLANGFNAMNVQLRVQQIHPIISPSDLVAQPSTAALAAITNASLVVPEATANNSVLNTALRNALLAPSLNGALQCTNVALPSGSSTADDADADLLLDVAALNAEVTASFGFASREWQAAMLPAALPERSLRLEMASPPAATAGARLPMAPSRGAELLLHALHFQRHFFPWFPASSLPLNVEAALNASTRGAPSSGGSVRVASLLGLDGDDPAAFLAQARSLFNRSLAGAANLSRDGSALSFSSVRLSPDIRVDAVTMELPRPLSRSLAPAASARAASSDSFYDLEVARDCGPRATSCLVQPSELDAEGDAFVPPTTVKALALCRTRDGSDELRVSRSPPVAYACEGVAPSAMLLVGVSSRVVGDAFEEGPAPGFASVRNARKVYALTVARLEWNVTDLAQTYNATCKEGVGLCYGLLFVLPAGGSGAAANAERAPDAGSMADGQRHLLVGDDFLPVEKLGVFNYNDTERRAGLDSDDIVQWMPLLSVSSTQDETPKTGKRSARARVTALGSDLLLPHNVAANSSSSSSAGASREGKACSAAVEARVRHVLDNHLYMERGLQAAYTAGMFFLFQNAVVKDCVALADGRMTLKFDRNIEWIDFLVSSPTTNVVLTLTGCLLLVGMAAWIAASILRQRGRAVDASNGAAFVTPQVLAKVLLDEETFPPALLQRRLLTQSRHRSAPQRDGASAELLEDFAIEGLRLQRGVDGMAVELPMAAATGAKQSSSV